MEENRRTSSNNQIEGNYLYNYFKILSKDNESLSNILNVFDNVTFKEEQNMVTGSLVEILNAQDQMEKNHLHHDEYIITNFENYDQITNYKKGLPHLVCDLPQVKMMESCVSSNLHSFASPNLLHHHPSPPKSKSTTPGFERKGFRKIEEKMKLKSAQKKQIRMEHAQHEAQASEYTKFLEELISTVDKEMLESKNNDDELTETKVIDPSPPKSKRTTPGFERKGFRIISTVEKE